jgi:hypothetical protein
MMKEKLVQQVYMMKAYKRTGDTMKEKYEGIQKVLEADRDFAPIAGTGKGWEAFRSQFSTILSTFEAKYSLSAEGANLSGLDAEAWNQFTGTERVLADIYEELESMDEKARERTEKQKKINSACLTHEGAILARNTRMLSSSSSSSNSSVAAGATAVLSPHEPSAGSKDSVASGLTDDVSNSRQPSVKSLMDSFLGSSSICHSPSKEELRIKEIEARNENLRLKIQLASFKICAATAKGTHKNKKSKNKKKKTSKRKRDPTPSPSSSSSDSSVSSESSEEEGEEDKKDDDDQLLV